MMKQAYQVKLTQQHRFYENKTITNLLVVFLIFLLIIFYVFLTAEPSFAEQAEAEKTQALSQTQHLDKIFSGLYFQSPNTQAMQNDDFANPGMLWVDQGKSIFETSPSQTTYSDLKKRSTTASPACNQCHSHEISDKRINLVGAATHYPQYDDKTKKLINLEQRINRCRTQYQKQAQWAYESQPLLAVTAWVAHLSKGMAFNVNINEKTKPFLEAGKHYYYQRRGQMNLSCHQCHEQYYGKKLRGDTLSQGHSNGYPIYRLEWQTLGSLHRRLRFCNTGIRAEPFDFGADTYVNLELFLAWRAQQLPIETPAVRR